MSGFWRPWAWMAAGGFLLSTVTLWRERVWRSRRGSCIGAAYAVIGYLAFTVILQDWAWPKPIVWDLPGEILQQHFGACLAAFGGFVAGAMYCDHRTPHRKDAYKCPTCGDDLWLLRDTNNWLEVHSMQDEMAKVAELPRTD